MEREIKLLRESTEHLTRIRQIAIAYLRDYLVMFTKLLSQTAKKF
jgi:hypothetical protein